MKRFQPDRYPTWMLGKDSTPIDHTHATPGTTPELQSWLQRRRKNKPASKGYFIHIQTMYLLFFLSVADRESIAANRASVEFCGMEMSNAAL